MNKYWIGVNEDYNDKDNWSDTEGGSGGADLPGAGDTIKFDGESTVGRCKISSSVELAAISFNENMVLYIVPAPKTE